MKNAHGPQGIRIWQGYRAKRYLDSRQRFIDTLGELFIPATVQMMEPIGLKSYFPTILPESKFRLPDEIALVAYDSQDTYYRATKTTTPGRAYGALHGNVFNFSSEDEIPKSKSAFPIEYQGALTFGQPYYLCDNLVDWRDNKTNIYCAQRSPNISKEDMLTHINDIILVWQKQNVNVNGSILVCEADYVLYWEHSKFWDSNDSLSSLFPFFAPVLQRPVIAGKPLMRTVPTLNTFEYDGLSVEAGSNLDIRLIDKKQTSSPITSRSKKINSEFS